MLASFTTTMTVLALVATAPQGPQAETLKWEADYGTALKQTRSDDRPLLVVIDNPAAEKQQVDSAVLTGADSKLLGAYDLCRVDAGTEYGKRVAEVFDATSLPYMAIIDKTGTVILHSQSGAMTAEAFETTLTKYQAGERAVRVTVAKPIVTEGEYVESTPIYSGSVHASGVQTIHSSPSYYSPPADCPNCRRGY